MGKVLGITSGKGGVGKSTVSIGLAMAFAESGEKVLLVDMDEGLRCLDLMLGVDSDVVFDLADVLMGKDIEDALQQSAYTKGLYLIPAPASVGMIDVFSFARFVKEAAGIFDRVIFDFPAGIDLRLYKSLPKDALFLTVAVPDPVSLRDAAAISTELDKASLDARLVINRFIYKQSIKWNFKNIDSMIDASALRLIGIVPEAEELAMLSLKHKLSRKGKAIAAFKRISRRICGENVPLKKIKKI